MNMQAGHVPIVESPRRWDFLAGLMLQLGFKTFVEVGCKEGRTTGHVLKTVPDALVWAIDPWCAMPAQAGTEGGETYEKWDFAKIEADFWANVGEHKERCTMSRMTSAQASGEELIAGAVLYHPPRDRDLVFIDAAHDYANVKSDIHRWWPLVREGGVLAGHDFNHKWPGVERAVAECFNLLHIGVGPDSVWFVVKQEGLNAYRE